MSAADRGWGPGWPDCQRDKIVPLEVNGTPFPGGVREEVHDLFVAFLTEFHQTVEWLVEGWCWGFACRAIRGTDRPSNHSWGLAVDINAPRHPMGKSGTFTSAEAQQCRALAKKYGLRWGGDYSGRKDEMHFEFMGTRAEALAFTGGDEMLTKGDSGNAVALFQRALIAFAKEHRDYDKVTADQNGTTWQRAKHWGADGDFGDTTVEMVKDYQKSAEVDVTGSIGGVTASLLVRYVIGTSDHDHSGVYAPVGHDHPSAGTHNHDSRYAAKGHGHTVPNHKHAVSPTTGGVE